MSKYSSNRCSNKLFILNEDSEGKLITGIFNDLNIVLLLNLLENPTIASFIIKNKEEKEIDTFYTSKGIKMTLLPIETSIEVFEFIEKVKSNGGVYSQIKMIPCQFMRSVCIRNINPLAPVIDVHYALQNLVRDFKKIILVDDCFVPGINRKICLVEFNSFHQARNALNILNSQNLVNFNFSSQSSNSNHLKVLSNNQPLDAVWCEPLVDCAKEILKNSLLFFFENLPVNNYNIFHFKQYLENYLKTKLSISNCFIKKIRQYTNKVMVEFNKNPEGILDSEFLYEGRMIPIVPAMRPNSNLGKYREKSLKASVLFMKDEDKRSLLSRFNIGENFSSNFEYHKKLAENIYNNFIIEEKREKEREKGKERKRSESASIVRHKRNRNKDDEDEVIKNFGKESRKKRFEEEGLEKDSRVPAEKKSIQSSPSTNVNSQSSIISNIANANIPNPNILSQLTSLLINNPNSANILTGLQNFSALANLQNLITNPSILQTIQQLSLLNQSGGVFNNATNPLLALTQLTNPTNINQNVNTNTGIGQNHVNQLNNPISTLSSTINPKMNSSANLLNLQNMSNNQNASSNFSQQSNSIFNLPLNNQNSVENPVYFQTQSNQYASNKIPYYQQTSSNQSFNYSLPGMINISQNQNELYMNQQVYNNSMNVPEYGIISGQPEMETDVNTMKKYYEYLQSMNK
jgi:hypothetical protein